MKKTEVKYLGIVIGHTYDGLTIEFLDNELSKEIKKRLSEGLTISLSTTSPRYLKRKKDSQYYLLSFNLV